MRGKTILITGGNTGIGFATAQIFAQAGANIVILALGEESNRVAAQAIETLGAACLALTGDVTIEPVMADAVSQAEARFGALHYAFNNAGIGADMRLLADQNEADFDRLFAIDVKGVWLGLKYEIPAIVRAGGGAIVNSASVAGIKGMPKQADYCAAKHAVVGLTRGAAIDHAKDNVRVNAIAPGVVRTEMIGRYAEANAAEWKSVIAMHPMPDVAEPEEVARAVLFLCRDATKTTGAVFTIDSGLAL